MLIRGLVFEGVPMPIHFHCPGCKKVLSIGSRKAGSHIQCPVCNQPVLVSAVTEARNLPAATILAAPVEAKANTKAWPELVRNPGSAAQPRVDRRLLVVAAGLCLLLVADIAASVIWMKKARPVSQDFAALTLGEPEEVALPDNKPLQPETEANAETTPLSKPVADAQPAPVAEEPIPDLSLPEPGERPQEPARPQLVVKRRQKLSDEELRKQLLWVPEVKLTSVTPDAFTVIQPRGAAANTPPPKAEPVKPEVTAILVANHPDLAGLPMRMGHDCQLGKEPAENLQALSRKLRAILAAAIPNASVDPRPDPDLVRAQLMREHPEPKRARVRNVSPQEWRSAEAVPALSQILQAENKPLRLLLVELLSEIKWPCATEALAQRALFDLSSEVREAAIQALADRPRSDSRAVLMSGFQYPWEPVADHAAEALAALQDREAVPELVKMLRNPAAPAGNRELVRINHLSNCTLCHSRSSSVNDLVRGPVPSPTAPLPPITTPYYGGTEGPFVRADVTYLKQDFSVHQPVARPGPWPTMQRYDYVVRKKPVAAGETADRGANAKPHPAILFALKELDPAWKNVLEQ
jgi:hypothetical protein